MRPATVDFYKAGKKPKPCFSAAEMQRRQDMVRGWMAKSNVDACLFTSLDNINYLSGYFYSDDAHKQGFVITQRDAATVTPANLGAFPAQHSVCDNVVYTDGTKLNFFIALQSIIKGVKRIAIEFDHVTLNLRSQLMDAYPGVDFVDVAGPTHRLRLIKSDEETKHLAKIARISVSGAGAALKATKPGVSEFEVAQHITQVMQSAVQTMRPQADVMEAFGDMRWGNSGKIKSDDLLMLTCSTQVAGYTVDLKRTLCAEVISKDHLRFWEVNSRVHHIGKALLLPGVKCSDVVKSLDEIYAQHDLVQYSCPALRLDDDIELAPGMVVALQPKLIVPTGQKGAGVYREQDILLITEKGNRNLTDFPFGPESLAMKGKGFV
jgi:creatinase